MSLSPPIASNVLKVARAIAASIQPVATSMPEVLECRSGSSDDSQSVVASSVSARTRSSASGDTGHVQVVAQFALPLKVARHTAANAGSARVFFEFVVGAGGMRALALIILVRQRRLHPFTARLAAICFTVGHLAATGGVGAPAIRG